MYVMIGASGAGITNGWEYSSEWNEEAMCEFSSTTTGPIYSISISINKAMGCVNKTDPQVTQDHDLAVRSKRHVMRRVWCYSREPDSSSLP